MGGLGDRLDSVVNAGALPFGVAGPIVALLMIVALRLVLPPSDRALVRGPFALLVAHVIFVALTQVVPPSNGFHRLSQLAALLLILICLGRAGFLLFVDTFATRRIIRPLPKIFRDILQGLVYTAALLITLRGAGAEVDALLTTSALLTAVIGLSLQDTLGNLFAGLSIQAQRPFEVGDWIQYDDHPDRVGRVVEINWRATKLRMLDEIDLLIPNGPLARAPIKNFTKPTSVSRRSVYVVVPREHPPHEVQQAIVRGVRDLGCVLSNPPPSVITHEFTDRGVKYWVRYFIDDFAARETTDGLVRDRVWYALSRAGIEIAVPVHDVEMIQDDENERARRERAAIERRLGALRGVDFCRTLPVAQLEQLAHASRERPYAPGEIIVREGEEGGTEFYIVVRGELVVTIDEATGTPHEVARLTDGSFFGEMSVMTGAARTATVRAATNAWLLVLDKAAFKTILEGAPELAEQISTVLAARQEELSSATSKPSGKAIARPVGDRPGQLLVRIKEFFSL